MTVKQEPYRRPIHLLMPVVDIQRILDEQRSFYEGFRDWCETNGADPSSAYGARAWFHQRLKPRTSTLLGDCTRHHTR